MRAFSKILILQSLLLPPSLPLLLRCHWLLCPRCTVAIAAAARGWLSLDRTHLLVDKVQVLGQTQHCDQRSDVLLHVLLLQLFHLSRHCIVHAACDFIGQATDRLDCVQHWIVLRGDGSCREGKEKGLVRITWILFLKGSSNTHMHPPPRRSLIWGSSSPAGVPRARP